MRNAFYVTEHARQGASLALRKMTEHWLAIPADATALRTIAQPAGAERALLASADQLKSLTATLFAPPRRAHLPPSAYPGRGGRLSC